MPRHHCVTSALSDVNAYLERVEEEVEVHADEIHGPGSHGVGKSDENDHVHPEHRDENQGRFGEFSAKHEESLTF